MSAPVTQVAAWMESGFSVSWRLEIDLARGRLAGRRRERTFEGEATGPLDPGAVPELRRLADGVTPELQAQVPGHFFEDPYSHHVEVRRGEEAVLVHSRGGPIEVEPAQALFESARRLLDALLPAPDPDEASHGAPRAP